MSRAAGSTGGWLVIAAAALLFAAVLTPSNPWYLNEDLDTSFAYALNVHAAQHLPVGTRVVSTFGPLGFLFYNAYYPDTFAWLLGLRALLAALTGATLAWLGGVASGRRWGMLLLPLACLPWCLLIDAWAFLLAGLAALLELTEREAAPRGWRAAQVAVGIGLGLFSLVKLTFLLALVVVGIPLVLRALSRRRASWTIAVALLTSAGGWVACRQPLAALPQFLRWGLFEISAGYPRAMQMWPHHFLVLHAWLTAAVLLAVAAALWAAPLRRWTALYALGFGGLLYLAFRAGFVRAIDHLFITTATYQLLGLVLAAFVWRQGRRAAALALATLPLLLLAHGLGRSSAAPLLGPLSSGLDNLAAWRQFAGRDHAAIYAAKAAALRARIPLPPLSGRGDIYPHDASVLFAYGFDYHPRPVFQSYMAYTQALAELNRAFLVGSDAADWLLFRIATVDSRYPSLDDDLSWPALLAGYRLVAQRGRYLQLARRAQPEAWTLTPLGEQRVRLGEPLGVPSADAGPIWATIDVRDGPLQRLIATAVQGALVVLQIETASGPRRRFRLIPSLGRGGFLLSPLVDTTLGFARLAAHLPDPTGLSRVRSLTIGIEPRSMVGTFDPLVDVAFFRLDVAAWAVSDLNLSSPAADGLVDLLRGLAPPDPLGGAALISTDDGREAVNAHAPARFRVPLRPGAHQLALEYGIRGEGAACTDGVRFRVSGERGGSRTVLFERLLTPRDVSPDRGLQRAAASWPADAYDGLTVETLPNGSIDCDWAYISALRIE